MAGIGFKLRRYTEEGSYFGILKGYTYSAIIVAGPWLLLVLALGALAWLSRGEMRLFHVTIMYVFCFSLIYLGIFQFVVTRYLADKLYSGQIETHLPTFVTTLMLTLGPQAVLAGVFLAAIDASLAYKLVAHSTYLVVNAIWVILLFMGVLRAYEWAVWSFLIGGGTSLAAGLALGRIWDQVGHLGGFLLGQLVTFSMLMWLLCSEFPWKRSVDFEFLTYFRRFPSLAILGVCYYLSTWVDKFIMRTSSQGELVVPRFFYAAPDYEVASFVAQLTIVPALAMFFMTVETDFYERYREFFASIAQHRTLDAIEGCRDDILRTVRSGLAGLLKVQGTISLLAFLLAPQLFRQIWLDPAQITVLRVMILGTFFQTMLFLVVILMLYFECYDQAVGATLTFLLANAAFTMAFLKLGPDYTGWGFAMSAALALGLAIRSFIGVLRNLTEVIFMKQPLLPVVAGCPEMVHPGGIGKYHLAPPERTPHARDPR